MVQANLSNYREVCFKREIINSYAFPFGITVNLSKDINGVIVADIINKELLNG